MRFVDANVFLHAFLQPKGKLAAAENDVKQSAKTIIRRIEDEEKAVTSAVHISEVSNVLESQSSNKISRDIIESILLDENIEIVGVDKELYVASLELAKIHEIGINDCVALNVMQIKKIKEIYSFDADFDRIEGIKRVEK